MFCRLFARGEGPSAEGAGEYEPATDFWRPLRNAIAAFYQSPEGDKRSLAEFLVPISDRKVGRYQAAMAGHARFARRKEIHGFRAPSATWEVGALRVRINPEIGLHIDGRRFISKLYFKAEPLSRGRAQALIALMEEDTAFAGCRVDVFCRAGHSERHPARC